MEKSHNTYVHNLTKQLRVLLRKNWILSVRNRRGAIFQILSPFFFLLFLFLINLAITSNKQFDKVHGVHRTQDVEPPAPLPECIKGEGMDTCYIFIYSPRGNEMIHRLVNNIRLNNDPTIPASAVRGFANLEEVNEFQFENQNITYGAMVFNNSQYSLDDPGITAEEFLTGLEWTLQYNHTSQHRRGNQIYNQEFFMMPFLGAIEQALVKMAHSDGICADEPCGPEDDSCCTSWKDDDTIDFRLNIVKYPHPELLAFSILGEAGPLFFFGAVLFQFVVQLGQLVLEKETGLREGMRTMGLMDMAYWLSWIITDLVMTLLASFVLCISGQIFRFDFFVKNAFGLYFFCFFLFGLSMMAIAFLLAAFVKKSRAATGVGFAIFIVGFLLQIPVDIIYRRSTPSWVRNLFSLAPPVLFAKGVADLAEFSDNEADDGIAWSQRANYTNIHSLQTVFEWFVIDFFIFMVLAWYFDNVQPTGVGARRPWNFLFTRAYWTGRAHSEGVRMDDLAEQSGPLDEDVAAERRCVMENDLSPNCAVRVNGLVKVYRASQFRKSPNDFMAVKGAYFHIDNGELFCLLGPNGAGKTTIIHMLTGLHPLTAGSAEIFGFSIVNEITRIRTFMGVCPQFDVLWGEVSGREHLEIFSELKGLRWSSVAAEVDRRLEEVQLTDAQHMRSSSYSGGMRRRLSVAIAMIGNPKIVFLDEPTTGMDPVSRRQVWSIIESAKKGRVIVLTTHSMEEADILGDNIAIIAKGRMQCIGPPIHLKNKFGTGYRFSIISEKPEKVKEWMARELSEASIEGSELSGHLTYNVPRQIRKKLPAFFSQLDEAKDGLGITDLQLSLTTLEEVFLRIAHDAELKDELEKEPTVLVVCPTCKGRSMCGKHQGVIRIECATCKTHFAVETGEPLLGLRRTMSSAYAQSALSAALRPHRTHSDSGCLDGVGEVVLEENRPNVPSASVEMTEQVAEPAVRDQDEDTSEDHQHE